MSGRKKEEPDRTDPGWRDYAETESVGRPEPADDLEETEEQISGGADPDGDGTPERTVGSSPFVSRDVKTEVKKKRMKDKG